ncbi:uncharacterized protein F4822DRAFT_445541 [Hypoxylon trugodes]|uniref:uncharacterized protein n=1 Tax=Hypoxylon trugodes TaxID=326681 RepID=UPI002199724A|nr:uncharacterized protein F4822DRAFT_445541 [Hypoxylon trugodes]KAI1385615.1 hypothetical protein F4822DRAFT_445541 [Hypoxylon trugodes]
MSKFSKFLSLVEEDDGIGRREEDYRQQADAFINAPIFTAAVDRFIHTSSAYLGGPPVTPGTTAPSLLTNSPSELIPQYGLIGIRQDLPQQNTSAEERLVFSNMNTPWSAFICGSQGAGKSHTVSCLLENALMENNAAGKLPNPLAGMVMHYDHYANYTTTQICEAAYLCSSGIPVTVLVSPSNIWAMKRLYKNLPGLKPGDPRPKVLPLYLEETQLDITTILKLMAVNPAANDAPLYMEVVMNIAREMAMEGPGFAYSKFRERIDEVEWVRGQTVPLNMRLQLLDSLIAPSSTTKSTRPASAKDNIWAFEPGSLTIVDLSDPFYSSEDACTLFSICLSIFLEHRNKCGRIVVLDEAHKFLHQSGEARVLTNDLLSIIRQQRHTGTRVLIATQEPTLSPQLIDLANVTIVHRFLSPSWYEVLKKHLAGARKRSVGDEDSLFNTIVTLQTGQALLFCPTAQVDIEETIDRRKKVIKNLGEGFFKIKIRKRVTADGGRSILATDLQSESLTNGGAAYSPTDDVPMFIVAPSQNSRDKSKRGVPPKVPEPQLPAPAVTNGVQQLNGNVNGNSNGIPNGPSSLPPTSSMLYTQTAPAVQPKPPTQPTPAPTPTTNRAPSLQGMGDEITKQARAMLLKEADPRRWTGFTRDQRDRLAAGVEKALQLPAGMLTNRQSFTNILMDGSLISSLVSYLRQSVNPV